MRKILTTEIFKEKANKKHNHRYNYDLVEYTGSHTKVPIKCEEHGVFWQTPSLHWRGGNCPICSEKKKYTNETFKEKASIKHNNFYIYDLVEYSNNKTPVKIICPIHGIFEQRPDSHLRGIGCMSCFRKVRDIEYLKSILTIEESPIEKSDGIYCECTYCKEHFKPTLKQLHSRIEALYGRSRGEHRLYCSDECKELCPIYYKSVHPDGTKPDTSRPDQPELRQLTLERDNFTCQRCGSTEDLVCHHFTGVYTNPVESADIDNCITLCYTCHMSVHSSGQCDTRRQPCVV